MPAPKSNPKTNSKSNSKTNSERLRDASRTFAADQPDAARKLLKGLPLPDSLSDRAAYLRLHRDLDMPLPDAEAALNAELAQDTNDPALAFERAQALFLLERPETLAAAKHAVKLAGTGPAEPTIFLLKVHLEAGRPDAAAQAILDGAQGRSKPGGLLLAGAKIMGQAGHKPQAIRLLDAALPHQQDNMDEYNFVAAGIKGTTPSKASQSGMAEAIFDKFAGDYDTVLAKIGYSAPDLIGDLLAEMPLKKMRRLHVLDAGCGTGLCAKLLRPYAKSLHGADISVPMLEKAKKRKIYNDLTRSDLNAPATIPAGPFDLVVLADVLIYFADLAPILAPLGQRLKPGGWLLFTVEDGGTLDAPGYILGASGRYKHCEDHITQALTAAGLGRPKNLIRKTLRHEFGVPVEGLAIAAQKPMLAF